MILLVKGIIIVGLVVLAGCSSLEQGLETSEPSSARAGTVAFPASNEATSIRWLLAKGQKSLESGDHRSAYEHFSQVLRSDRSNPEALRGLGESILIGGEPQKALSVFAKLEQLPDHRATAYQGQGLALLAMGQHAKAEGVLEKALREDTHLWRVWNALGTIKDRAGLWKEARQDYDKALEINSNAIEVMNNRGTSFLWERKFPEAELAFKAVLGRSPELPQARTSLRLALAWQGKYVEALTGTRKDELPVVLNNLGYIATKRGDYEVAEAYLAQALQLSPSYYAKAAENLEYLRQLKNAATAQNTDLSGKKKNR